MNIDNLAELFINEFTEFKPLLEDHIEFNEELLHMFFSVNATTVIVYSIDRLSDSVKQSIGCYISFGNSDSDVCLVSVIYSGLHRFISNKQKNIN